MAEKVLDKKKIDKKVKRFLETESPEKQFKYLIDLCEKCPAPDLCQLFQDQAKAIYDVFLENFNTQEAQAKKGKPNEASSEKLMNVLAKIISILGVKMQKERWQVRTTVGVLEKLLYIQNKHAYRVKAFELLLELFNSLGNPDDDFLKILAASVDFSPFVESGSSVTFKYEPLSSPDKFALIPRAVPRTTKEETLEFFGIFLDFITKHSQQFDLWIRVFKYQFVTTLYPGIAKQLGWIDKNDNRGFVDHCPYDIQVALFPRLEAWLQNETISSKLWCNEENASTILEIFRQSCYLPLNYRDTLIRYVNLFHSNLFMVPPQKLSDAALNTYRKNFFAVLPYTMQPDIAGRIELCLEILHLYKVIKNLDTLTNDLKETILLSVLQLATQILQTPLPDKDNNKLVPELVVDGCLNLWIKSRTMDPKLWAQLHKNFSALLYRKELLLSCRVKLAQVLFILKDFIFTFTLLEKQKKTEDVPQKRTGAPVARTPDFREPKVPQLLKTTQHDLGLLWDFDTAKTVFLNLLEIFRNVNKLTDPIVHAEAMRVLCWTIDVYYEFEDIADYKPLVTQNERKLSMINIFGPWLFEAAELSDVYTNGKAKALAALCRMCCRHSPQRVPISLLVAFYSLIKNCLIESSGTKVSYAILKHSANIFSLSLPGANTLIPYYILEIKNITQKADKHPQKVLERCVMILASLVPFSNHLGAFEVPVDSELLKKQSKENDIGKKLLMSEIKHHISSALINVLKKSSNFPSVQSLALCTLTTLICEEAFVSNSPNREMIWEWVSLLLENALNPPVSALALSMVTSLTTIYEKLRAVDEKLPVNIVQILCNNIATKIDTAGSEKMVADHFFCLREWLMAAPAPFFNDRHLIKQFSTCLALGLKNTKMVPEMSSADLSEALCKAPSTEHEDKSKKETPKEPSTKKESKKKEKDEPKETETERETQLLSAAAAKPLKLYPIIQEAAEAVLFFCLNFLHNFPNTKRYDVVSSRITDIRAPDKYRRVLLFNVNKFLYSIGDVATHNLKWVTERDPTTALKSLLTYSRGSFFFTRFLELQGQEHLARLWRELRCKQEERRLIQQSPQKRYHRRRGSRRGATESTQSTVSESLSHDSDEVDFSEDDDLSPKKAEDNIKQQPLATSTTTTTTTSTTTSSVSMDLWASVSSEILSSLTRYFEIWRTNDPTGTFEMGKDCKARILVRDYTGKYAWDCRLNLDGRLNLTETDIERTKSPYLSYNLLHKMSTSIPRLHLPINLTSTSTSISSASSSSSDRTQRRTQASSLEIINEESSKKESSSFKPSPVSSLHVSGDNARETTQPFLSMRESPLPRPPPPPHPPPHPPAADTTTDSKLKEPSRQIVSSPDSKNASKMTEDRERKESPKSKSETAPDELEKEPKSTPLIFQGYHKEKEEKELASYRPSSWSKTPPKKVHGTFAITMGTKKGHTSNCSSDKEGHSTQTQTKKRLQSESIGDASNIHNLEALLEFLSESSKSLTHSHVLSEQFINEIKEMTKNLSQQIENDSKAQEDRMTIAHASATTSSQSLYATHFPLPSAAIAHSPIHHSRMLLNQLGWLVGYPKPNHFLLDIENPSLVRALRGLDKVYGREQIKIGLVYVAEGQEDERDIFCNEAAATPLYEEFVKGMAKIVDLRKHKGYLGGLDTTGSSGTTAPYYATATLEVIFHEIVRMPTKKSEIENDKVPVSKKRHVGNDIVHIVWSSHRRDYKPSTISSKGFGNVQIIIYPLHNGLFRIQIAKKKEVGFFGPLIHNAVVSKRLLPILIRQTAINAHNVVRFNYESYLGSFHARKGEFAKIISKFQRSLDYKTYLLELLMSESQTKTTPQINLPPSSSK